MFFIDASSTDTADQGFSTMARICKVGESMDDFKRYLTNSLEPWLLIVDNADDPSLDISRFFPVGNRGSIIVTTRNPECKSHATVGSRELREMESHEAVNLLLRSGDLQSENQNLRRLALPIVQTLGYLALAVNHAGASIRQKICLLEDYLDLYTRHRKKLLSSQAVQAGSEYKYTVYTTWEISVESIKKLAESGKSDVAANALEILTFFGFCHFDDITEEMFRSAWGNLAYTEQCPWWASNILGMIRDYRPSNWESFAFNEVIHLLSSYSLVHVSGSTNRISLHPLVHSWIRDSLNEEEHLRWWNITVSTLALSSTSSPVHLQRQLKAHLHHCIGTRKIDELFQDDDVIFDRVEICFGILQAYIYHPWKDGLALSEQALEYSRRVLGNECYSTCELSYQCARSLEMLLRPQNALDLLQSQLDVTIRVAGPADRLTLRTMTMLAETYIHLNRPQEALELAQKSLAICEKSLDESDYVYLETLEAVAWAYREMDRYEDSIDLHKKALAKRKEISDGEDGGVLFSEFQLACAYGESGHHQTALDIFQSTLKGYLRSLGEDHPNTLYTMAFTARKYGNTGQPEKGIPLLIKALDMNSRVGLEIEDLQVWKEWLEWLQSESAKASTTVSQRLSKSWGPPQSEDEGISNRKLWRFWSKSRRRRERSPS